MHCMNRHRCLGYELTVIDDITLDVIDIRYLKTC